VINFIIRRLLASIPTLLAVLTLVFLLVRVVPGDPAIAILGDRATPDALAAQRTELGLDRWIGAQYVDFLGHALRGDLGTSMVTHRPVWTEIAEALPHTIVLTLAAMAIGCLIGIPAGIVRMNFWKYSLYTLAGAAAWCAVLCWLGVKVGGQISKGEMHKVTFSILIFLAVVGALYYFLVHRHMKKAKRGA